MIRDEILDFAATIISKAIPQPVKPSTTHDPKYEKIFSDWIAMLRNYGWFIYNCDWFTHNDPGAIDIRQTSVMTLRHRSTPTEIRLYHTEGFEIEAEHVLPDNGGNMYWTKSLGEMQKHIRYTKKL